MGPRGGGGGGQGQRQTWAGLPGRACCCKRGREGRRQGDWRPVPGVVVPGVHSSHQPCFRKAPRTDTSRPLLGMPHLLPALAYGDGVGWGGRALQWLHFLGLRPNISLSLRQSCPGWSPTRQQDLCYCKEKEKEKVGCQRGLGQPGWGRQEGGLQASSQRGRLSGEWSEPSPHHPCAAKSGPRCCSPLVC